MQFEIFSVPVTGGEEEMEKMNRFLRGHKVVQVDRQLVTTGTCCLWTFCVNWLEPAGSAPAAFVDRREKVDYRNVLNEEQFKAFSRMRVCRKRIADDDAVPAYAVFTDAELAILAQAENLNAKTILQIDGIGKKRMEKYGVLLLKMSNQEAPEPAQPEAGDGAVKTPPDGPELIEEDLPLGI